MITLAQSQDFLSEEEYERLGDIDNELSDAAYDVLNADSRGDTLEATIALYNKYAELFRMVSVYDTHEE